MEGDSHTILFGDWRVDPELNRIVRAGEERKLERRAMDVLVCLLEHPGHVLSCRDILDRVWADQVVEESAVHQRISQIRRALGDNSRKPRYIESIPRRGYRAKAQTVVPDTPRKIWPVRRLLPHCAWLIAIAIALAAFLLIGRPPQSIDAASVEAPPLAVARFAVLPLRDVTSDQRLEALAAVLSQELRHELVLYQSGMWPDWRMEVLPAVASRSAPSSDLAAISDYVVEGTVNRDHEGTVLKIELSETATGDQLWAQSFRAAEPFAEPSVLAGQAARHVAWFVYEMAGGGAPARWAHGAYSEFLKIASGDQIDLTAFWLQRALEIDPAWRGGWEGLSWTWLQMGEKLKDRSYFARAMEANPAGFGWESFLRIEMQAYIDGDLDGAEIQAREHALNRGAFGYAWLMLHSGLHREGEAYFHWFIEQMPHHPDGWRALAMARALRDDAEGALEASRQVAASLPAEAVNVLPGAALALPRLGRLTEAKALLQRVARAAERATPASATAIHYGSFLHIVEFEIAMAEQDTARAHRAADRLAEMGYHASAGIRYLQLGDPRAEEQLDLAAGDAPFIRRRWLWLVAFTPPELRDHPSFVALGDALGYTHAWRRELCLRASTLGEPHIHCDPRQFESSAIRKPPTGTLPMENPSHADFAARPVANQA